jgi:hypothetical protein
MEELDRNKPETESALPNLRNDRKDKAEPKDCESRTLQCTPKRDWE